MQCLIGKIDPINQYSTQNFLCRKGDSVVASHKVTPSADWHQYAARSSSLLDSAIQVCNHKYLAVQTTSSVLV